MKNIQSIEGFDLLRIICIAAVIGIHCLEHRFFNRIVENLSFAVPCFVMLSIYFSANNSKSLLIDIAVFVDTFIISFLTSV